MIRAIIFDCFGVLTVDTWQEFAASLPSNQRTEASVLNRVYDAGHLSRAEFGQAMQALTGRQPRYVEDLPVNDLHKNAELFTLIKKLKPSYKIGLLSNIGTNWVLEHFLSPEERALFDTFVFSFDTGLVKPDERIYRLVGERLGEPPAACVMIDDLARNCQGAEDSGMQAIVYRNLTQMRAELQALLKSGAN
jgi:epoxide hydrolase-like predicted phosphatase